MTNKRRDKRKAFTRESALKWLLRDGGEPDYETRPATTSRTEIGWAFTFRPKNHLTEDGLPRTGRAFIVDDRDGTIHNASKKGIFFTVHRILRNDWQSA